jgi:predicted deacylase
MRTLGMLPTRRISMIRAEPYLARSSKWFRAPMDGVFRPLVKLGARVEEGDTLGVVAAPFSDAESVLTASQDGIVICVNNMPLVNEGDALFHIARFAAATTAVEDEIAVHGSSVEEDRLYEIETIQPDPPLT